MTLNATLATLVAGQVAASATVNNNLNNLNNTTAPTFNIVNQTAGVAANGYGGATFGQAVSGHFYGVVVPFATTMLNVPSSITLTATSTSNFASLNANGIRATGFNLFFAPNTSGDMFWEGTWATVGNCILEVHDGLMTFHHHCDGCDTISRHRSIRDHLRVETYYGDIPGRSAIAHDCPECGRTECFNTGLSSEDERPLVSHPTRHEQAILIRAVQQALKLRIHP